MFIPFLSTGISRSNDRLYRRKGGGKSGGKSGSSSKGSSSSSSKGSSSSGSSKGSSGTVRSSSISAGGTTKAAKSYSYGSSKVTTIPSGQLFSGRTEGGGTRPQVYGTQTYGSGYPGVTGRGVANRNFPFYFWPMTWGAAGGAGAAAYLHESTGEYGAPDNTSRPGGVLMYAGFTSNSTSAANTTLWVIADNSTIIDLITDISSNCSSSLASNSSTSATSYNPDAGGALKPEQVVQYYRASSVALLLSGYNDTAALQAENTTANVPLPSDIDTTLLNCVNDTIGAAVLLVDGAQSQWAVPHASLLPAMFLVWLLMHVV
ncbi:hypothetical protein FISHEDRAFT_33607 [Fistulina hepatica ATCC 64428]|uniref:Uncharacterized protein n=1 Tax=Fistulina hepatica ATCC 64428 TaxID=1128425 RepID=A0A0D7APM8_9AGAR|nr:hypothetical protein FISHEDRAFT_33607 [Fistulina hepatica ATCC 64428]